MKKKWYMRLAVLLLVSLTVGTIAVAAASAGSSDDPLVTLSYLNNTYTDSIMNKVDSKITTRNSALESKFSGSSGSSSATFELVTLTSGKTLMGDIGTEFLLRVGTATCVADSSPGLVDTTDGTTINSGASLTKNHLYMATIENRGFKATAATVKVMVRGTYTVS
ncbi:MAG: hypothetical protein VB112_08285 [Oscillospiraceae bacterium]|nr:hypothetical protein [Oscillospiraceae bacterium]